MTEESTTVLPEDALRSLARAREIAGGSPGSLALVAAAIKLDDDPELAKLTTAMLLDPDDLRNLDGSLADLDEAAAADVVECARERFDDVSAASLIAAAAVEASPRFTGAVRMLGMSTREVAAQLVEWRRRQDGDVKVPSRVVWLSGLGVCASAVTSVLLLLEVVQSGDWWKLILLFGVWNGYPQEGPVVGGVVTGLLFLFLGPVVAIAHAVTVLLDVVQAWVERNEVWLRTGVRISLREQRYLVRRRLTGRSRRMQSHRQITRLRLRRQDAV